MCSAPGLLFQKQALRHSTPGASYIEKGLALFLFRIITNGKPSTGAI